MNAGIRSRSQILQNVGAGARVRISKFQLERGGPNIPGSGQEIYISSKNILRNGFHGLFLNHLYIGAYNYIKVKSEPFLNLLSWSRFFFNFWNRSRFKFVTGGGAVPNLAGFATVIVCISKYNDLPWDKILLVEDEYMRSCSTHSFL